MPNSREIAYSGKTRPPRNFPIFKWLHRGQATHSPLDLMAGFCNWSPLFPPPQIAKPCHTSRVLHKTGGTWRPWLPTDWRFLMATIYPGFFFSTSPETHMVQGSSSYRIYPASVRPGHGAGLSQNFLIGTHGNMANRVGTGTRRVHTGSASTRLADWFSARPSTGAPSAMWLASAPHRRQSAVEWCYGAQRLVGARHRDFRRRGQPLVWP